MSAGRLGIILQAPTILRGGLVVLSGIVVSKRQMRPRGYRQRVQVVSEYRVLNGFRKPPHTAQIDRIQMVGFKIVWIKLKRRLEFFFRVCPVPLYEFDGTDAGMNFR